MPRPPLSAQRAQHGSPPGIWLGIVALLVLAVAANQLGASSGAVLGFTALQVVLFAWWVLSPQADGPWTLLIGAVTVVSTLGLLALPSITERERTSGPPALSSPEPAISGPDDRVTSTSGDGTE